MTNKNIELKREGHFAILTVNRPDKLNALNNETLVELGQAVQDLESDAGVGVVILTGAGEKAFVAGADISVLAKQGVEEAKQNSLLGQRLTLAMEGSKKPYLAAINGFALGGGLEMALACDVRFCSSTAKLGLPEVSLGIIPGYGGTQRLPRLVGTGAALHLILTGDPIGADEALRIGLVNQVCAPQELMETVKKAAARMLARGQNALGLAKEAVRRGMQMGLPEGLALEADLFAISAAAPEMKEGMIAFLEKRKPSWIRS